MLATIRRTARFAKIVESQPARHPPVPRGQATLLCPRPSRGGGRLLPGGQAIMYI